MGLEGYSGRAVLADHDIKKILGTELMVDPLDLRMIRPNSIRLRLSSTYSSMVERRNPIDTRSSDTSPWFENVDTHGRPFTLPPRTFVLAASLEKISVSRRLKGLLNTGSSLARIGISCNGTSGLVPSRYGEGGGSHLTFELYSVTRSPIALHSGMPICHLTLLWNASPAETGYSHGGGIYQGAGLETANLRDHPST